MNEFDDPFNIHQQSIPSGRSDAEGREIRFVGRPILALNPATNNCSIPDIYRCHPLVAGRHFYTLPRDVIDTVVANLGEGRFDSELLAMERLLSEICGDHSSNVGFWDDLQIIYCEFRRLPAMDFSDDEIRRAALDPTELTHAMHVHQDRDVVPIERFAKAYCGWLMTNPQFIDEHDSLLRDHATAIARWGTNNHFAKLPSSYRARLIPGTDPHDDPLWPPYFSACNEFLTRWRLSGLAGPYLPTPAKPLLAGTFPLSVVRRLMECGGVFFLPDTMPLPSRDQFRSMLDDALHRREGPFHLEKWLEIARAGNMARNQMDPYIRRFELQHYWRLISERHVAAVYRNINKLETAFAQVFNVAERSIHLDMIEIRNKLGKDWLSRS